MHTAHKPRSRWLASLPVALIALTAGLTVPSSAAAADQFCYGSIKPIEVTEERESGVSYQFACREAVRSFLVVSSQELSAFGVDAEVYDPDSGGGAIRPDDRFGECEGETPGYGFGCSGTYSAFGRVIRGSFDTTDPACSRDPRTNKLTLSSMVIVGDAKGKLSGPYKLARPKDCNKAPFLAPKAVSKPKASRR
ncbi:MAG: hypothetical protein H0V22_06025 [Solirubrobacterales bacterium]|nr:hypothetical protein [Solirubrobacterales bacterium]